MKNAGKKFCQSLQDSLLFLIIVFRLSSNCITVVNDFEHVLMKQPVTASKVP
jgi:hypothetical protein